MTHLRIVPPVDYDTRPSTFERVGEALNSPFGFGLYCGIYIGCLLTVGLAWIWSVLS